MFGFLKSKRFIWEYGTCLNRPARRHRVCGNVQFILWKAGEQGHAKDFWFDMNKDHWKGFVPSKEQA